MRFVLCASTTRAGRVKKMTPKVERTSPKPKPVTGRARMRGRAARAKTRAEAAILASSWAMAGPNAQQVPVNHGQSYQGTKSMTALVGKLTAKIHGKLLRAPYWWKNRSHHQKRELPVAKEIRAIRQEMARGASDHLFREQFLTKTLANVTRLVFSRQNDRRMVTAQKKRNRTRLTTSAA